MGMDQQSKRLVKNRFAFTLTELLVVITIISVLISLLLPVLSKAKEQAQQITCINNSRQIAAAVLSYAGDNDGYFVMLHDTRYHWYNQAYYEIAPYIGMSEKTNQFATRAFCESDNVFWCPGNKKHDRYSYNANGTVSRYNVSNYAFNWRMMSVGPAQAYSYNGAPVNIATVSNYAKTVLAAEIRKSSEGTWTDCGIDPQQYSIGVLSFRAHPNGNYFSFMDGHVEVVPYNPADPYYQRFTWDPR